MAAAIARSLRPRNQASLGHGQSRWYPWANDKERFPMRALPLLLALAAATPAPAQEQLPAREAELELAGYADCVVSHRSYAKPVDAFLRTVPDSAGFYPASLKAADMTCLNTAAVRRQASKLEMRLQPATFRDALYPALYRRDFGRQGPPAGIAALPPLGLSAEFAGDPAALPAAYRPGRALGDCVARGAPADVHAMLMARPWSPEEAAAVGRLRPALANCLSEGQTVQFGRATLRAYLGEALYKLARAAQSANSSTGVSR
jgi:hypothetical protein